MSAARVPDGVTLWQNEPASGEGAVYEGEYRGTLFQVTRTTDRNVWSGRNTHHEKDATETWWDGWIAHGVHGPGDPSFACIVEHEHTRREALGRIVRHIDSQIGNRNKAAS
jgi:hypothetical protein